MKSVWLLLFALILFGCRQKEKNKVSYFEDITPMTDIDIKVSEVQMDSLLLDSISNSTIGKDCISAGNIYFIDEKFCFVHKFDTNGKLILSAIGQGDGDDELPIKQIHFFSQTPAGGFFFIGPSWDCFEFDSNFHRINDYGINWHSTVTKEQMLEHPDPAEAKLYSLLYGIGAIHIKDNNVYMPLLSQHPTFNPTVASYAQNARILAKMDLDVGYVDKIFGRLTPKLISNQNASTFSYCLFDLSPNNTMTVAYPSDSLIYNFNDDFDLLKTYGRPGRDMDTAYRSASTLEAFRLNYANEIKNRGYYKSIKFVPEKNLVFRSYQKNQNATTDGIQVYSNGKLVADFDVPIDFSVEGYIAPFYYSNAFINKKDQSVKVYKFKLPQF